MSELDSQPKEPVKDSRPVRKQKPKPIEVAINPPRLRPEVLGALRSDIEMEIPLAPQEEGPHDSAALYSQLKGRDTERVIPLLHFTEKGHGQALIIALLVGMCVFAGWGTAYEAQYLITPHIPGTCAAPAVIENGGCFVSQTSTDSQGNSHTTLIPAGTLHR